jgi:hypothetical protein
VAEAVAVAVVDSLLEAVAVVVVVTVVAVAALAADEEVHEVSPTIEDPWRFLNCSFLRILTCEICAVCEDLSWN